MTARHAIHPAVTRGAPDQVVTANRHGGCPGRFVVLSGAYLCATCNLVLLNPVRAPKPVE